MRTKKLTILGIAFLFMLGCMLTLSQPADACKKEKTDGPAWKIEEGEHPSLKGLQNAYKNVSKNGASKRAQQVLKNKIEARGGEVEDVDKDKKDRKDKKDKKYKKDKKGKKDKDTGAKITETLTYETGKTSLEPGESTELTFIVRDKDGNRINLADGFYIDLAIDGDNVLTDLEKERLTANDMSTTRGKTKPITIKAKDGKNLQGTATIAATLYTGKGKKVDCVCITYTVGYAVDKCSLKLDGATFATEDGWVAKTNKELEIKYELSFADKIPADKEIILVVENTGSKNAYLNISGYRNVNLAANDSKTFKTSTADLDTTYNIAFRTNATTDLKVSVQLEGNPDTLKTTSIHFYDRDNTLANSEDITISGTVVAFDTKGANNNGTEILVETSEGERYYLPAAIRYEEFKLYYEDNNTHTSHRRYLVEKGFEQTIQIGDKVKIKLDDKRESANNDKDTITIIRDSE